MCNLIVLRVNQITLFLNPDVMHSAIKMGHGVQESLKRSLMRVLLYDYCSLLHSRVGSEEPLISILIPNNCFYHSTKMLPCRMSSYLLILETK